MCSPAPDAPVVISDFGLAVQLDAGAKLTVACGTPGYVGSSPWDRVLRDGG